MYRREGGVNFLMVVSQNFRHQSEGDGVVVKDRGYAKEEAIKSLLSVTSIIYQLQLSVTIIFYSVVRLTKIQSFIKYDR